MIFLGAALMTAAAAEASLFAAATSWRNAANGSAANSQTVALLGAALNPNPQAGQSEEARILDGALLADAGPLGTIADVVSHSHSDQISVYVVRPGDTLSEIATMYGVSVNTIRWANDLSRAGTVQPGQVLTILPITGVKHQVVKGDTLATIAKKYGADLEEIAVFNGLDTNSTLTVGGTIIVPDGELSTPVSPKPRPGSGKPTPSYDGYYLRPITGGRKSQGLHGYNGVDLAAPAGTQIYAAADGVVIVSKEGGWNGGYGNYVVIRHNNGTQTLYAHNQSNAVAAGETVKRGQVIGYVGNTGRSTGAHVHFEIRGAKNPF